MINPAWFDLPVNNLADAMSFYQGLLGWEYRLMDGSVEPDYVMIESAGVLIGGLRKSSQPLVRTPDTNSPILYFTVAQLAPAVSRARELGAERVGEEVQLGKERGRYQWIRDREGNLIGLWARE